MKKLFIIVSLSIFNLTFYVNLMSISAGLIL
jgi:hypothetical protein